METPAPSSPQTDFGADAAFIHGKLAPMPGWLNDIAAAATFALLRAQDGIARDGGFVEIGVYGGKYLSVLARHSLADGAMVLGLDTFHHFSPEEVRANVLTALSGEGRAPSLQTVKASSQHITAEDIRRLLGGPTRLFHVDGSHEGDDVLWDLEMAEAALAPAGLIVIDDFFSPYDAGVSEAVFRFQILRPRPLVPVAYVSNKLFLARHSYAPVFRSALEEFMMQDREFPESERFRGRLASLGRRMIETRFFGYPYIVVT